MQSFTLHIELTLEPFLSTVPHFQASYMPIMFKWMMPSSGCKGKINQYTLVTFILALINSGTPIRLENHRNNKWMIAELSPFQEKLLHIISPSQEHAQGSRHITVKVDCIYECKHRGLTRRCKPLVTLSNRKAWLDFTRKHLKDSLQFWKKEEKTRLTCTSCATTTHHLSDIEEAMLWRLWQPVEPGHQCLLIMWLLIEAAEWLLKCTRPNATKLIQQRKMDNHPNHKTKAIKEFVMVKKIGYSSMDKSDSWSQPNRWCFSVIK